MQLSHWQLLQVLAVGFRLVDGGVQDTTLLHLTAATTRRRTPAIMDRQPIAVSMVLAALWLRLMRLVMVRTGPMEQAAAPIPVVILVDHQDVLRDRALERNPLVH